MTQDNPHRLLHQGFQALSVGDLQSAAQAARLLLSKAPKLAPAHLLVGQIALARRDHRTAVSALKTVVSIDAFDAAGWACLARAFMMGGMEDNALIALDKAVALNPSDAAVLDHMGTVYSLLEDQNSAAKFYQLALAQSDRPSIRLNRAKTAIFLGNKQQARDDLEAVLASNNAHPEALWLLARLQTVTETGLVDRIQTAISQADRLQLASPQNMAYLHYGLGKVFEDLSSWDEAFAAYSAGAIAKRQVQPFDRAAHDAFFDALQEHACHNDQSGGFLDGAQTPVFVLGQPRTGTTLVEQLIAAEPGVHAAGELPYFPRLVKKFTDVSTLGPGDAAVGQRLPMVDRRALGEGYLAACTRRSAGGNIFTDKLPSNFYYAMLIAEALPSAKIVHVRRGGLDSIFASFKQLFADAYPHSYHLDDQAQHWLRYHQLMQTYKAVLGDRLIDVQYEDLVRDLAAGSRELYQKLGFNWTPDILNFQQKSNSVTTASAAQVREKVHTKSVGKWRHFEKHLAALQQRLHDAGVDFEDLAPD